MAAPIPSPHGPAGTWLRPASAARRYGAPLALVALSGLVALGCRGEPAAAVHAVAPARSLDLFFTTSVGGYLEPCGCTSRPLGGLARLATVVSRAGPRSMLVDAGDLLLPADGLDGPARAQHERKARVLARAYRMLGAAALNVGPRDVALGLGLLKQLQRDGAVPFVSSSVRPVGDGGPSIAQSFVREHDGIRVGFTGVATPEAFAGVAGLAALEALPALRAEVSTLRARGVELIVVLAHVDVETAEALARELSDVDVIVRAPGTAIERAPAPPRRVGGVVLLEAGSQGQHVGHLHVTLGGGARGGPLPFDDGGRAEAEARALAEKKRRALQTELDALVAGGTRGEAIEARRAQLTAIDARLAKVNAASGGRPPALAPGAPGLRAELIALDDTIPDAPAIAELLRAYDAELAALNAERGDMQRCAPLEGAPRFVGNAACQPCHAAAVAVWERTAHARAWATLAAKNKTSDLTCVGCHVVGWEQPSGPCTIAAARARQDVGCEACHGPGSAHSATGDRRAIARGAGVETCTARCHVPEHSDTFAYGTYRPRILGPGHGEAAPR
jgi:hypothetical protein